MLPATQSAARPPGAGNVISGNDYTGIYLSGVGASGNVIAGNLIGVDATGTMAVGNGYCGIDVSGSAANTIGGTATGARNVISGNSVGVLLFGEGASSNVIEGNYIGTNAAGTAALGNGYYGVSISDGASNTIGGTATGAGNVISGNGSAGVVLGSSGNLVQGNYIGTDATGTAALGNRAYGVDVTGGSGNTIGGTTAAARNVISSNYGGVCLLEASTGNLVEGNYIGTDSAGTAALGNTVVGVVISNATGNTIGGTIPGAGNVISGSGNSGVCLEAAASGNLVQGNFIGTNAAGTGALGNWFTGVLISGAASNTIGGTTNAARNVISGNGTGVYLDNPDTINNLVEGNLIGTNADGTGPLGNWSCGVWSYATGNTIGGTVVGAGNVIENNGSAGVFLSGGTGTTISGNSIYNNGGLGIDLGAWLDGATPNDWGDVDTGTNYLQNFPMIGSATVSNGTVTVIGSFNSLPDATFQLEFFLSDNKNSSGYGEGQVYKVSKTVHTDHSGNFSLSGLDAVTFSGAAGKWVSATATDASGNTSEFSQAVLVNNAPTLDAIDDPAAINEDSGEQTINLSGISAGAGESQTLRVMATSSNTTLLPTIWEHYTSPSSTGTLSYTPAADQSGSALVTVTVTDAGPDGVPGYVRRWNRHATVYRASSGHQ